MNANTPESNSFLVRLDPKIIEVSWGDHLASCSRCSLVDLERTATLANACPEGSQYLKTLFAKRRAPELTAQRKKNAELAKQMRGEFWASKAKVARLTKYK